MKRFRSRLAVALLTALVMVYSLAVRANNLSEYQIKAGFVYNFATFTQWPKNVGPLLNLCVHGDNPFGNALDDLHHKKADNRKINVVRGITPDALYTCHIIFISQSITDLTPFNQGLKGYPILTVSDVVQTSVDGIILHLNSSENKIRFEVNLTAAHNNKLKINAKLLRLASRVINEE